MDNKLFFIYLIILACSTYLIRVIPFVAIKQKINNRFIRSFLYYVPYAVLTAMTIPAIFYATSWWVGAAAGHSFLKRQGIDHRCNRRVCIRLSG